MNTATETNEKIRLLNHIEALLAEGLECGHYAFQVEVRRATATKTKVVVAAGKSEQFVFREDEFTSD